jgi:TATA element modulatory factor
LLQEVNYLSSRNAQLEEEMASMPRLSEQLTSMKVKNELLLTMLGEKQEELEGVLADMKEVKNLYREELDQLLARIAPSSPSANSQ